VTPEISDARDCFGDRECDVHTLPDDENEHELSGSCWCEPELYYVDPESSSAAWAHRELH